MITDTLIVLAAIVVIAVIWAAAAWFIQREPAGHGQHGMRRDTGTRSFRRFDDWDAPQVGPRGGDVPFPGVEFLPCRRAGSYASVTEVHHPKKNLPGPVSTSKNGRAGEPRNLAGPMEQGQGHRAGEPHHRDWTQRPLSAVRDGLAPWVEKALAGAKVSDTAYGPLHDTTPFGQWLEQVTGGDPWNGKGSSDEYTDWLFAGMAGAR